MSETKTPVSSGNASEGRANGVSGSPDDSADGAIHGRTCGGEGGDDAPYEREQESRGSG